MKDIVGQTASEQRLIKEMQRIAGTREDGYLGIATLSDIAIKLGAKESFPAVFKMFGYNTIVGNDLIAFDPNGGIASYTYSMLGGFTYPSGQTPCSILINGGKVVCGTACHAHIGKPEGVIFRFENGGFGCAKVKSASELPKGVRWAIGGMSLGERYDPASEGFTGAYSDVLRKTNHNVLMMKGGKVYGVYFPTMTGAQIQTEIMSKFKPAMALLLDGGHLAAMNAETTKINTNTKQGYAIQFI